MQLYLLTCVGAVANRQVLGLLAFGSGWDGALAGGLRIPEPSDLGPPRSDSAKEVRPTF